ncbi:hypothetical protein Leryth_021943 [Lithospermum erythrorhizon]|nr:hypothetical protein Leryth_021943 [Lithospermum erythrorhizon]
MTSNGPPSYLLLNMTIKKLQNQSSSAFTETPIIQNWLSFQEVMVEFVSVRVEKKRRGSARKLVASKLSIEDEVGDGFY